MEAMKRPDQWFEATWSLSFPEWLARNRCSIAFTTYQSGKLFMLGTPTASADATVSIIERNFPHCMGMCVTLDAASLWLSSRYQILRLDRTGGRAVPHVPVAASTVPGADDSAWCLGVHDVAYVPRIGWTTGHLDVHDMAIDRDNSLVFVNTLFGCLATVSDRGSFRPLWRPRFLSALVPEDRCHLNGLAMQDGRPAFVTIAGRSDALDGWRAQRRSGGCVLDVATSEAVCTGLSMPHSPRVHAGNLWVLNSGTGEIGTVDRRAGRFQPVAAGAGFLRGLCFHAGHGIVTVSKPRGNTFGDLAIQDRLDARHSKAMAGLIVIDLSTGCEIAWFRIESEFVTELYDAVVLPDTRNPAVVGFKADDIERFVTIDFAGNVSP
jgi:uncharacterized protein (TIGR03032 family)